MDFLESIKSVSWVNTATYLSVLLTLFIFFYQELSSRIDGKKEVKSIVEEIVDLVIRNHASKKIGLTEVDLEFIVAGFENLKQIKLAIAKSSFLKMIYAKVYTNEHITTDIRKEILRDLDIQISNTESNENVTEMENKVKIDWKRKNEILASIICVLLLTLSYKYILVFEYFQNDKLLTFVLIFCLLIFVIYWLKPNLSSLFKNRTEKQLEHQIELVRIANFEAKDNKPLKFRNIKKEDIEVPVPESDTSKEIKTKKTSTESKDVKDVEPILPQKETNAENIEDIEDSPDLMYHYLHEMYSEEQIIGVKRVLELRFIFENLINKIHFKVYETNSKLPPTKILNKLYNDKILNYDTFEEAREILFFANRIIHGERDITPNLDFFIVFQMLIDTLYFLDHDLTKDEIKRINNERINEN